MPTLVVIIMDLKPLQQVCRLNWSGAGLAVVYEQKHEKNHIRTHTHTAKATAASTQQILCSVK